MASLHPQLTPAPCVSLSTLLPTPSVTLPGNNDKVASFCMNLNDVQVGKPSYSGALFVNANVCWLNITAFEVRDDSTYRWGPHRADRRICLWYMTVGPLPLLTHWGASSELEPVSFPVFQDHIVVSVFPACSIQVRQPRIKWDTWFQKHFSWGPEGCVGRWRYNGLCVAQILVIQPWAVWPWARA